MVARALKACTNTPYGRDRYGKQRGYGVFWDFMSLHQHERTAAQTELFKQGLGSLGMLYSHPHTYVFRLTSFPAGYPEGYNLPSGANVAAYPDRGCAASTYPAPAPQALCARPLVRTPRPSRRWCFTESGWATMTKSSTKSLDLGRLKGTEADWGDVLRSCAVVGRPPPLLPLQSSLYDSVRTRRIYN